MYEAGTLKRTMGTLTRRRAPICHEAAGYIYAKKRCMGRRRALYTGGGNHICPKVKGMKVHA